MRISPRTSSKLYTLFFFTIAGLVLSLQFIFLLENVLVFETIAAGVLIGLILGLLEVYIFRGRLEQISFTLAAFLRLAAYLVATIITIFVVMVVH